MRHNHPAMNAFLIVLLFIMMLAFLYVLLSARLTHQLDTRFKEHYRAQLLRDMQEFYREMESYAALLENRITRFKKLTERHEEFTRRFEEVADSLRQSKKGKQLSDLSEFIERSLEKDKRILDALAAITAVSAKNQQMAEISEKTAAQSKPATRPIESVKAAKAPQPAKPSAKSPQSATVKSRPSSKSAAPAASVADELTEKESLSAQIAESVLNDLDVSAVNMARKLEQAEETLATEITEKPETKPVRANATSQESGEGFISRMLAGIGRAVLPVISGSNPVPHSTHRTEELNREVATPAIRSPMPAESSSHTPSSFLEALNQSMGKTAPPPSPATALEKAADELFDNAPWFAEEEQPAIAKLDPVELGALMQLLSDQSERPKALRKLLAHNFTIKELSSFSGIPMSELELTRRLYGL